MKHSDAQSSDSSQRLVPAASVQPRTSSRRMFGHSCGTPSHAACPVLKARDIAFSTGLLCCVRCCKLTTNSEAIAEVHEHTVRVLCTVVNAERAWDSHIYHEAFHDRIDGGLAFFVRAVRPL